ncbi:hypothetical protein FB451DRAFT_1170310 [Mycena latifolia]|nr:hypothetical protein FB451DRAFT_1170310 [Mycena latifolia]
MGSQVSPTTKSSSAKGVRSELAPPSDDISRRPRTRPRDIGAPQRRGIRERKLRRPTQMRKLERRAAEDALRMNTKRHRTPQPALNPGARWQRRGLSLWAWWQPSLGRYKSKSGVQTSSGIESSGSIIRSREFEGIQEKAESGEHRIRRTKTIAGRVKAEESTVLTSGDGPNEGKPRVVNDASRAEEIAKQGTAKLDSTDIVRWTRRRGAAPGTCRGPAGVEQPRGVPCGCGVYAAGAHRVLCEGDAVPGALICPAGGARALQGELSHPRRKGNHAECKAQRRAYTAEKSHVPTRPGGMRGAELDGAAMRITPSELARAISGGIPCESWPRGLPRRYMRVSTHPRCAGEAPGCVESSRTFEKKGVEKQKASLQRTASLGHV